MKKSRILLFGFGLAAAVAAAAAFASASFAVEPMPIVACAFAGLTAWLFAPAADFVARHVKQALAMSLQSPGGRSPAVALIAAKARHLFRIARERITVTSTWRMCPST